MSSVQILWGPYWAHAVLSMGPVGPKHFYDTSGTFKSTLKAPDAHYSEEGTPRHPQNSHGALADAVRFCNFSHTFYLIWALHTKLVQHPYDFQDYHIYISYDVRAIPSCLGITFKMGISHPTSVCRPRFPCSASRLQSRKLQWALCGLRQICNCYTQ